MNLRRRYTGYLDLSTAIRIDIAVVDSSCRLKYLGLKYLDIMPVRGEDSGLELKWRQTAPNSLVPTVNLGAGNETRTRDLNLGKIVP